MIDNDRLDELETYRVEDDTPEDARISLPWRDLRDLVALIPVARAGRLLCDALDDQRNFSDGVIEVRMENFDFAWNQKGEP